MLVSSQRRMLASSFVAFRTASTAAYEQTGSDAMAYAVPLITRVEISVWSEGYREQMMHSLLILNILTNIWYV